MNAAVDFACTESGAAMRRNVGRVPFVRLSLVADAATYPSPAFLKIGPAASTSWLAPGPMTPRIDESDANFCETVDVTAGSNFVSPSVIFIVGFLCASVHC